MQQVEFFKCFSVQFVFFLLVNAPIQLFVMYTLVSLYEILLLKWHYKNR